MLQAVPVKEQDSLRDILWCCAQDDGLRPHLLEPGVEWLVRALVYGRTRKSDLAVDRALECGPVAIDYFSRVTFPHKAPVRLQAFVSYQSRSQLGVNLRSSKAETGRNYSCPLCYGSADREDKCSDLSNLHALDQAILDEIDVFDHPL